MPGGGLGDVRPPFQPDVWPRTGQPIKGPFGRLSCFRRLRHGVAGHRSKSAIYCVTHLLPQIGHLGRCWPVRQARSARGPPASLPVAPLIGDKRCYGEAPGKLPACPRWWVERAAAGQGPLAGLFGEPTGAGGVKADSDNRRRTPWAIRILASGVTGARAARL
jgi:hypothetical protein